MSEDQALAEAAALADETPEIPDEDLSQAIPQGQGGDANEDADDADADGADADGADADGADADDADADGADADDADADDADADDADADDADADDTDADDDDADDADADDADADDADADDADADDDDADDEKEQPTTLYQLDSDLLSRVEAIVGERERVYALIDNTRNRSAKVKSEIFSRVIADYQRQLGEIEEQYKPLSQEICQSLMAISALEVKLREEIDAINDRIVEMRFRCEVGEFSEEDLFPIEEENRRQLKYLKQRMQVIDETFDTCRPFLQEIDFEEATGRPYAPQPEPPEGAELEPVESAEAVLVSHLDDDILQELPEPDINIEEPLDDFDLGDDLDDLDVDPVEAIAGTDLAEVFDDDPAALPVANEGSDDPTRFELWPDEAHADLDAGATMAAQSLRHYIVHVEDSGEEQAYPLGTENFGVGRHPQNDLILGDRGISRRHAQVILDPSGQYLIKDLSSGNGIYINGERVAGERLLNDGDKIAIGKCRMVFLQRLE